MAIGLTAVSAFLIDMIGDGGVAFDECNEFVGDVDGMAFRAQHDAVVVLLIDDLHIELHLSGRVVDEGRQVFSHVVGEIVVVDGEGDALQAFVFHGLHVLNVLDTQIVDVAVAIALLTFCRDIDDAALAQHAAPTSPFFAEEGQFAAAFEIFDSDKATRVAIFGEL